MDARLKLIELLKEASQFASDNSDKADNIDLIGISESLDDYVFDLEQIGQFEIYEDERELSE